MSTTADVFKAAIQNTEVSDTEKFEMLLQLIAQSNPKQKRVVDDVVGQNAFQWLVDAVDGGLNPYNNKKFYQNVASLLQSLNESGHVEMAAERSGKPGDNYGAIHLSLDIDVHRYKEENVSLTVWIKKTDVDTLEFDIDINYVDENFDDNLKGSVTIELSNADLNSSYNYLHYTFDMYLLSETESNFIKILLETFKEFCEKVDNMCSTNPDIKPTVEDDISFEELQDADEVAFIDNYLKSNVDNLRQKKCDFVVNVAKMLMLQTLPVSVKSQIMPALTAQSFQDRTLL